MPGVKCFNCGQGGHRKSNCPYIQCHHCRQMGHFKGDCPALASTRQQQPKQRRQRSTFTSQRFDCYGTRPSDADLLPSHWEIYDDMSRSVSTATASLQRTGERCLRYEVDSSELEEVKELVYRTWRQDGVGKGVDGLNLDHSGIKVLKVERIENPAVYGEYSNKRQTLVQSEGDIQLLHDIQGNSGQVWTWKTIAGGHGSILQNNIYPRINEHYLFHGTKDQNVNSIAENGFDVDMSSGRSLMGAGLYFTESSTKADMYADHRNYRTSGSKHMFLVRVLLGDPYLHTVKEMERFEQPPCKTCSKDTCSHYGAKRYDSVINDCHIKFRGFVVYDNSQCYPEYLVTYQRIQDDDDDDEDEDADEFGYIDTSAPLRYQFVKPDPAKPFRAAATVRESIPPSCNVRSAEPSNTSSRAPPPMSFRAAATVRESIPPSAYVSRSAEPSNTFTTAPLPRPSTYNSTVRESIAPAYVSRSAEPSYTFATAPPPRPSSTYNSSSSNKGAKPSSSKSQCSIL